MVDVALIGVIEMKGVLMVGATSGKRGVDLGEFEPGWLDEV